MGHRREVYRPRSKRQIRRGIQQAINEGEFETAATIAAFSYSSRPIADDFAISLIATAEAITLGRDIGWQRSTEDLVTAGLSIAEKKLESRVFRKRRQIVFEAIAKSVELAKREESS